MLKYEAATSLNQEVQMLNAGLNSPLLSQKEAYIVRAQITTVPYAHGEPYDTYCTFNLFPANVATSASKVQKDVPILIPLLVSDDIENSIEAKSVEQMQQFILGVSAMLYGVGASGDFDAFRKNVQSVMGSDMNSLLTVSSLSPNTLTVRLGAMYQAGSHYAMIPRNHFVTFLMIRDKPLNDEKTVTSPATTPTWSTQALAADPKDTPKAESKGASENASLETTTEQPSEYFLGVRTLLRNSETGEILDQNMITAKDIRPIFANYPIKDSAITRLKNLTDTKLENLVTYNLMPAVAANNLDDFQMSLLRAIYPNFDIEAISKFTPYEAKIIDPIYRAAPYLWSEIISLRLQSPNCTTLLELPKEEPITLPLPAMAALMTDDTTSSTLTLDGFSDLFSDPSLNAYIKITRQPAGVLTGQVSGSLNRVQVAVSGSLSGKVSETVVSKDSQISGTMSGLLPGPGLLNSTGQVSGFLATTTGTIVNPISTSLSGTLTDQLGTVGLTGTVTADPNGSLSGQLSSAADKQSTIILNAQSVTVAGGGKTLQAVFPSLSTYVEPDGKGKISGSDIKLYVTLPTWPGTAKTNPAPSSGYTVLYTSKAAATLKPSYNILLSAQQIIVNNTGGGVLEFTLKQPDGASPPLTGTVVNVTVTGADIDTSIPIQSTVLAAGSTATTSAITTAGLTLSGEEAVTLHLINMMPGSRVSLGATEVQPATGMTTSDTQAAKKVTIPYTGIPVLPVVAIAQPRFN
jgi:hypothetical protein